MWFTLVVGLAFVAISVAIAVNDPDEMPQALAVGSFFGLCALVAADAIRKRFVIRRNLREPAVVQAVGGATIRARVERIWGLAAALIVVGGLGVWAGPGIRSGYAFVSGLIVIAGLGVLVADLGGWTQRPSLQFRPEGLWFLERGTRFVVPWDVLGVGVNEIHDNVLITLRIGDLDAVLASVQTDRGADAPRVRARLRTRLMRHGGSLQLPPWLYGQDAVRLTQVLLRYVREPATRAELVETPRLVGP